MQYGRWELKVWSFLAGYNSKKDNRHVKTDYAEHFVLRGQPAHFARAFFQGESRMDVSYKLQGVQFEMG
jgi:hypothetical protein